MTSPLPVSLILVVIILSIIGLIVKVDFAYMICSLLGHLFVWPRHKYVVIFGNVEAHRKENLLP